MSRKLLLTGTLILLAIVSFSSCSDNNREPGPCTTCPEIVPAYAAAFAYIESNEEQIGLRPDLDQLLPYRDDVDQLGMTHIRFHQYYLGVRVIDGEIIIHVDTDTVVTGYSGDLVPDVTVDQRPSLAFDSALGIAQQHFSDTLGYVGAQEGNGELAVLRWQSVDYLCWTFVLAEDRGNDMIEYFIDHATATIVRWRSLIIIG